MLYSPVNEVVTINDWLLNYLFVFFISQLNNITDPLKFNYGKIFIV